MKTIYIIGGTMGVGKTAVCRRLNKILDKSVFLDGDSCWDMHPFQVTDETKAMVLDNICYLLNNFIRCSVLENIVFCWVMHEQSIIDDIMSHINTENCKTVVISLMCTEKELRERLRGDIDNGLREPDIIDRSTQRIELYKKLNTVKIDTSDMSIDECALRIIDVAKKTAL